MKLENIPVGLTYDDLLLIPQKSEVVPAEVSTKTYLTPTIRLNVPIVSAAMDVLQNMATFAEAAIDDGYLQEIRDNERFQS